MAGPQFFQTVMGRRFYEGDVPRIASALTRIAEALEGGQKVESEQLEVLEEEAEERGDSSEDVRRGLRRGAELVRAFDVQVIPGVSLYQQREVLSVVAQFVESHSETYGRRKREEGNESSG